ncbi:MAG: thiamine diphosphokinase [Herpetosiphon sp.]
MIADAPNWQPAPYLPIIKAADLVIACDGAARHFLDLERLPDVVIGDFDSLPATALASLIARQVSLIRFPVAKDETDLELGLLEAVRRGATSIDVLGALGGRPDQHLANIHLLAHPRLVDAHVRLIDGQWQLWIVRQQTVINGHAGDTVSLIPLTEDVQGITTVGLHYPLHDEAMKFGPARGVSNVLVATEATVHVRAGCLLVLHERSSGSQGTTYAMDSNG